MQRFQRGMSNGGAAQARNGEALDMETLHAVVPSLFATKAHESRSDRFAPIPTIDIVRGLQKEGFQPFFAQQARTRDTSRRDFTRHVIRMRHESLARTTGEAFEIILSNANDGTAAYQMLPGFFRFVCMNGLFVGDSFEAVKVRHTGNAMHDVIDGAYTVLENAPRLIDSVDRFKAIDLDRDESRAFARLAHMARFPNAWENDDSGRPQYVEGIAPIDSARMLQARRYADKATDLWTTFNVAQENAVRGGLRGRVQGSDGRARNATVRAVKGIAQATDLNRKLWTLADELAALKAA
jgi:hypothetical protein